MRLKKLVILGFKSFADKTTLHFDEGITCIVGPNGCGKSNISDAFRWVLGEQSAKSMRGGKMPDIIFAGTDSRKPLNFAEVSLTLTDVQGTLPVDYEEVTITRRLHRNGESEYLLNGNAIRLKDLQTLFLDSGVGRNTFSIFEQGKIDQVINYTPYERRYIFEEAAGILRFLLKKKEALKRLEQADLNLSRIKDIYHEVEKQIQVLKGQAEKAKLFKENKDLLEILEKTIYVFKWDALEKKGQDTEKKGQKIGEEIEKTNTKITSQNHLLQENKQNLLKEEQELKERNEKFFQSRSEKEIYLRDYQSNQQRIAEASQREKKVKLELEELKVAQKNRQKALTEIQKSRKTIEHEFQDSEKNLAIQLEHLKAKEKEVTLLRQQLSSEQQKYMKHLQTESQVASECKQNETRLENSNERLKVLKERHQKLNDDQKQIMNQVQEKKQQLSHLSSLIDTHKENLELKEEEIKTISRDIGKLQIEYDGSQKRIVEQKARQKVLLRLREENEGFTSGSKRLLQETANPQSPLYNKIKPLYEFLNPDAEAAEALSVILRQYASTLVIEKIEDLLHFLQFTQENQIHDYSIICMEMIQSLDKSKIKKGNFLKKVIQNPVSNHFLQLVEEVHSYTEAFSLLKESLQREIWIEQGFFIDNHQVITNFKTSENGIFLREAELRNLEIELEEKEQELNQLAKKLGQLEQMKSRIQLERAEIDKILRRDEMKLVELNFGYQRSLTDHEKIKNEIVQITKDHTQLEEQVEIQQNVVKGLQDKHHYLKQEAASLLQQAQTLEKEVEKQNGVLRLHQQEQQEKGSLFRQINEDRQKLTRQHEVLEMQEKEHLKMEQRLLDDLAELQENQSKITDLFPHFNETLQKIDSKLTSLQEACLEQENKIGKQKISIESIEKEIQTLHEKGRQLLSEMEQLSVLASHSRLNAQALEQELYERFEINLEEARQTLVKDMALEQAEKQARQLRHALQQSGDINMTSIEDLEKQETRFTFLNQQLTDMSQSKEELLEIIAQTDGESKRLFRETFEIIRSNFKKNFQILFTGGEADLQFTDNENILEAGIEIIAKPPGKQMRSISLLSGGEKCLTAVALLFSLFEVKPAPFCILDEIDAPLDDTNVERFTNVVKHFTDRCQFLIITHNKRTMAIGNVLFGVSMEEKGISKLLSLEFAASEEAPEPSLVER